MCELFSISSMIPTVAAASGEDMAAYGAGNFYGIPASMVSLAPPSQRYRLEKHELERTAQSFWL